MIEYIRKILAGQFEAALCMMNDCITKCPPEHWDSPIGKYPFWQVAYHTLCFLDLYLSPDEKTYQLRNGSDGGPILHPAGWSEFNDEYPSRRFEHKEIIEYLNICRRKMVDTFAAETRESLEGGSGQSRLPFSRGELHLYNMRHLQHHTGQLSAFLRRINADEATGPKWVNTGWR